MGDKIKMQFDPDIAREHGTDAAIIYSNIEFWVYKNAANGKHFHDGEYWTYNSIKAFNELFDYLSEGQIRRCLEKLEKAGLIKVGEYNKTKYDRTKWYSCQLHLPKTTNGIAETTEPIPYNKPDIINTDTKYVAKATNSPQLKQLNKDFNKMNDYWSKTANRKLSNNKTSKGAYKKLLKEHTNREIAEAIKYAVKFQGQEYKPQILSFASLYDKWDSLQGHISMSKPAVDNDHVMINGRPVLKVFLNRDED